MRLRLARFRPVAALLALALAAALTTPDPITMVAAAVPIYLAFEAVLLVVRRRERRTRRS